MIDKNALLDVLDPVRHCGDYGEAFFNELTGEIHLTMGDSDGNEEEGFTPFPIIHDLAMSVPGVQKVTIADEYSPDVDDEPGWIEIGTFGQEWYKGQAYPRRAPRGG